MQETRFLGWEDPREEGMATLSGILAWKIPWTEEPGRRQSIGLHRIRHKQSDLAWMHACIGVVGSQTEEPHLHQGTMPCWRFQLGREQNPIPRFTCVETLPFCVPPLCCSLEEPETVASGRERSGAQGVETIRA